MSRRADDISVLAGKLRTFLNDAGWVEGRHINGLQFYFPPQSLGIQGKYSVALPDDVSRSGMGAILHGAADSLREIYGYSSIGPLLDRAAALSTETSQARFVSRFVDLSTRAGNIPLYALGEYLTQLEKGLYNSAMFKLGGHDSKSRGLAQQFAKQCQFLQTREGSFVASVEVPSSVLRQGDLFGHDPVESIQVCSSMFSAINFLTDRVLNDAERLDSDAALADAIALFDVEFLDSLAKMIIAPSMRTIEFTLEVGTSLRTTSTGTITNEKADRLKEYVAFIKKHLRGEDDVAVTGSIVELRSRDPAGNKNHIMVVTKYHGDRTFISATLNNDQYQQAVDAHKKKRMVTLRGNAIRLKTHIRMVDITDFLT